MPRSTYPGSTDLEAFLVAANLTVSAALRALLPGALDAAVSDFEGATDRHPFLGDGSESERAFDPPTNGPLLFCDDLCGAPSSVVYQPASASAETLTLRTDYVLEPANALSKGQPITQLRFRRGWTTPLRESQRQSILITGPWGYAREVPDSVWLALLERGAANVWAQVKQSATGGVLSIEDADRKISFGVENWSQLNDKWSGKGCNFDQVVAHYRKEGF